MQIAVVQFCLYPIHFVVSRYYVYAARQNIILCFIITKVPVTRFLFIFFYL